jgi:hypothetical protein
VGLGLLYDFETVNLSGVGLLAPLPTPNLEDQGLHFIWSLPFELCGVSGPTRSLLSRQHNFPCHWARKPPLHGKAIVLEEGQGHIICKIATRILGCIWTYIPVEYTFTNYDSLIHSLTHEAEPFLRSCQLCSYSRTSKNFMEPEGTLPCSQQPFTGPYSEPDQFNQYHPILSP